MRLFVNGTLMRGEALHRNLDGCTYLGAARTAAAYRLFVLGNGSYPGMIRAERGGVAVSGEVYDVPEALVDGIFAREPPHLYLGAVELDDGSYVQGVLCDPQAAPHHPEISAYGGWRNWRAAATV